MQKLSTSQLQNCQQMQNDSMNDVCTINYFISGSSATNSFGQSVSGSASFTSGSMYCGMNLTGSNQSYSNMVKVLDCDAVIRLPLTVDVDVLDTINYQNDIYKIVGYPRLGMTAQTITLKKVGV